MSVKHAIRRSKVVFVNRFFWPDQSATSQMLSDLSFGLAGSGFSVHVLCSRLRYDEPHANLAPREHINGVTVHRVWTTRYGRDGLRGRVFDYLSFYLSSAISLVRLLARDDTVVAMTDPPLISIVAHVAARLKGARLLNWLQDIFPEVASQLRLNPMPRPVETVIRNMRNSSLQGARMNVVLGQRMREHLERIGVAAVRICVIENWADAAPPVAAACSELRLRLGLAAKFVIGYSGNLGRAHEFQTFLGAATLCSADNDMVFLMIGGGAGMDNLKRAVEQRGLRNFLFLPYQPRTQLSDSLAAADLHWVSLLPALEGLIVPSKIYGILAAARPLIFIGDREGEVARVIATTGAGATVGVGDCAGLAWQFTRLKSDPVSREAMGRNGCELYRERFTSQRALRSWQRILEHQEHSPQSGH